MKTDFIIEFLQVNIDSFSIGREFTLSEIFCPAAWNRIDLPTRRNFGIWFNSQVSGKIIINCKDTTKKTSDGREIYVRI